MTNAEKMTFDDPTETRTFPFGRVDLIDIGGSQIGRLTLEPGWRWSDHVKPLAGTDLCEAPHFQFHASGTLHVRMADGTDIVARPGDVTALPHGHDALIETYGCSNLALQFGMVEQIVVL